MVSTPPRQFFHPRAISGGSIRALLPVSADSSELDSTELTPEAHGRSQIPARRSGSNGFTLIEITFAIVILAGSLVVLLGLQSAATQATIRDARKQEAMLAARALMSALEVSDEELEIQESTAPLTQLLERYVPGDGFTLEPPGGRGRPPFEGLTGTLKVEFWPLPGLDPEVVKRINLKVAWSDSPVDAVEVIYFLPSGESTPPEEFDDE